MGVWSVNVCEAGVTLTLPDRYNIIPDRIHTLDVLNHVVQKKLGLLGDLCPLWIKIQLCVNYVIFHGSFAMDPPPACPSPGVSPLETTFPSLLWLERVPVGFKIRLPIEVYGGSPPPFANEKFYVRDISILVLTL